MEHLRQKRRDSNRQKIDVFNQTFEAKRQKYQSHERGYIYAEYDPSHKPKFTSIKQR